MKKFSAVLVLVLSLSAFSLAGDKKQSDKKQEGDQFSNLSFVVVKDTNGKPIRNASIVLHEVNKEGKQESGGFQLKTDPDGNAHIDDIPYGKLRIQVIAHGLQTYGEDYEINEPQKEITIRMKPPKEQYSIY